MTDEKKKLEEENLDAVAGGTGSLNVGAHAASSVVDDLPSDIVPPTEFIDDSRLKKLK